MYKQCASYLSLKMGDTAYFKLPDSDLITHYTDVKKWQAYPCSLKSFMS